MYTNLARAMVKISLAAVILLNASVAAGQVLFEDDFEAGLGKWVGRSGGVHSGVIVPDPSDATNNVLTFGLLISGGDMFGTAVTVVTDPSTTYILEFDYLGDPNLGGVPGDLGGAIGFAEDTTPAGHRWLAATDLGGVDSGIEDDPLVDDNMWRTYSIEFDPSEAPIDCCNGYDGSPTNDTIRVMLEDFIGSGGVAGDVYFDDIVLKDAANLIPVAVDDDDAETIANQEVNIDIFDNDDVGNEPVAVSISNGPTNGTVDPESITNCTAKNSCLLTYVPEPGFGGTDMFDYEITDLDGEQSDATVTVTVDASQAAVATGAGKVILNCADDDDCGIPFNWIYQFVDEPGELNTACCAAKAVRETENLSGRGKFGFNNPRDLDVGQLILDTIEATRTTEPAYAGDCANLLPLLPEIGDPDVNGDGVVDELDIGYEPLSVLRPWQRVAVNPTFITDASGDPDDAKTEAFYEDFAALSQLKWAICVTQSTAKVSGVAVIAENPAQVEGVGYSIDCEEDRLRYRPMTVGNSVNVGDPDEPEEVTKWLTTPWTAECDGSRSAKRSSTNIAILNATNDIVQNGPISTVSRLLANLSGEINAEIGRVFDVDPELDDDDNEAHVLDLENMHDKLEAAKDAVNAGKQAVKSKKNHLEPGDAYQPAINRLDELTCQALALDDPLDINVTGLLTGKTMNAKFMACSYLQHPDAFVGGDNKNVNSCPIQQYIEDIIDGSNPGGPCPTSGLSP